MDLISIRKEITITFLSRQTACAVAKDNYASFCYPKRIKLMRFRTRRFRVKDFGHFMTMHTKTPFGMELLTVSFMPGEGKSVPYLLIDIMTVGKKRTVFVEYYDCTSDHNEMSETRITNLMSTRRGLIGMLVKEHPTRLSSVDPVLMILCFMT